MASGLTSNAVDAATTVCWRHTCPMSNMPQTQDVSPPLLFQSYATPSRNSVTDLFDSACGFGWGTGPDASCTEWPRDNRSHDYTC